MSIEAIIFDVDGTLWDSAERVAESWTEAFSRFPETKCRAVSASELSDYMGLTMEKIEEKVLPGIEKTRRREIMNYAMGFENRYLMEHPGEFYPDFFTTVKALKEEGKKLYIVSNCQSGYVEAMLTAAKFSFGKGKTFEDAECFGNTGKSKAENIRLIMERNAISPENAVYVGDTELDGESAKEAGIPFIFASYGFGNPKEYAGKISSLPELFTLISTLKL